MLSVFGRKGDDGRCNLDADKQLYSFFNLK